MKVTGIPSAHWLDPEEAFRRATGEEPHGWQGPYLRETRNAIVLKGRQVGASTCAGCLAIRMARTRPRSLAAIISPSMKQSTEVKERAKGGLLRMGVSLARDSQSMIELHNGSRILSLPGSPKAARGWSADLLVIDEAAFIDPETFTAARATVAATGGRVIVQSTPAGPFGHFYDLWMTDDPSWAKFRVSSEDVPSIDPAFLASERAHMTEDEYAQEYLGEFARPGSGLVDPERLKELTDDTGDDFWDSLQ